MLCFDHGDRDRLGNMFPRRKDGVMKIRLSVLFVLGLVMAIGCASTPHRAQSVEERYFEASVNKCILAEGLKKWVTINRKNQKEFTSPDVMEWLREKYGDKCIIEVRDRLKKEQEKAKRKSLMPPPPPPAPEPQRVRIVTTPGDDYREALIVKCMEGEGSPDRNECTIRAQEQIRKECAENPNGMGELCK